MPIVKQQQSAALVGVARDFPDPPDFTAGQRAWWAVVKDILKAQQQEIEALRERVNKIPTS